MKTVHDKFRSFTASRREGNKREAKTSGVGEVYKTTDELLDAFIAKTHETEKEERRECLRQTQLEATLTTAGEKILKKVLTMLWLEMKVLVVAERRKKRNLD